ncbi:MAG TPA: PQQ-dependent dehydrogenase, methanol/ethanol family [Vicinamibacterales bacterium]|nr:PQQ-dependent dehydrogenase, methanol/ethanol family [Vicinamibacterales bacterium]
MNARPLAVMAGVLLAITVAAAQQSDTTRNPLGADPAAVAAGQRLYDQQCAGCHAAAGQGSDRAPALTGPLAHGSEDGDVFHAIRDGVPGTAMTPHRELNDRETWQLVSYIRSLAGITDIAPATSPTSGDATAGAAVFRRAQCATCHEIDGVGGIVGPDLSTAARYGADALRRKIVDPDLAIDTPRPAGPPRPVTRPQTITVRLKDGRTIRGVRRAEDTFTLHVVDLDNRLHLLDKNAIADVQVENRSVMPHEVGVRVTASDLTNLVAYLASRRERDASHAPVRPGGVTPERLAEAAKEPQNWLTYWGNYESTHYSGLTQITPANAGTLRASWTFAMPGDAVLEATPLVVDGVMYVTQPGTVVALDARTGRLIWRSTRQRKVRNPYEINPFNRGAAIAGDRLFVGTLDAALIALDARTGNVLWETQVADSMLGYSLTSAPLVVKNMVLVGVSGGEFGARGFLDAYDIATGKRVWRWYAVPAPGEFGNDTWKGDSWMRGGSPMWLTGSYDPELNTVYWAVGNPGPQIDRSARGDGDNLFSDSVIAIDTDSGTRKWHYQFTPNDGHDWDSVQALVLVDRVWHGQRRKLLIHADRNGFFYVLDRTNGRFLAATPFVYQNWNTGFDAAGRPQIAPGSNSSVEGSFFVYPTLGGGTNFQAPSYSPLTGLFYLAYSENGQRYVSQPVAFEQGRQYIGRGQAGPASARPGEPAPSSGIKAIDPETGRMQWDFKTAQGSLQNGVLATAGNVLFASIRDGNLAALDARTGAPLWHFQTGTTPAASPMSYAVDGKQYVAIAAGNTIYAFALP